MAQKETLGKKEPKRFTAIKKYLLLGMIVISVIALLNGIFGSERNAIFNFGVVIVFCVIVYSMLSTFFDKQQGKKIDKIMYIVYQIFLITVPLFFLINTWIKTNFTDGLLCSVIVYVVCVVGTFILFWAIKFIGVLCSKNDRPAHISLVYDVLVFMFPCMKDILKPKLAEKDTKKEEQSELLKGYEIESHSRQRDVNDSKNHKRQKFQRCRKLHSRQSQTN